MSSILEYLAVMNLRSLTKHKFSLFISKTALLISLLACVSLSAQKKYQGLLWEISGNGMERPSYLYGTMHVSNKVAFNLGDPFFDALESVDQVALELEPEDWFKEVLDGDLMSSSMRYGMSSGLMGLYGGGSWNEFEGRLAYPENINLKIQEKFRNSPRMINQLLFRFYDPSGNFEEETWLDMYIYQSARKLGKKTYGLETFKESMAYLKQAELGSRKSPQNFSQTDYQSRMEAQLEIENAYRKGDLDLLDSLSRQLNHKSFTKYILIERNKQFIRGMDSLMHFKPLFTGVGAAHLPGDQGCIEMLRELGYTVKSVNMGIRDTKRKDRLSESVMAHDLKKFTSADGRISFKVPGEAYEISADPRSASYFSMDIPNGLTFMVDVIASGNAIQKHDSDYLIASLDSMLFEIIPGDILSQKRVIVSDIPGLDIIHEVSRGDVNRTLILFSEQEVITARLAGSGNKVTEGAGSHYFSSLELNLEEDADLSEWKTVNGPFSSFSIQMRGQVLDYAKHKPSILGGDLIIQSVDSDKDVFQLHRLQDMERGYLEDDTYVLDKVAQAYAKDYSYTEKKRRYMLLKDRRSLKVIYTDQKGSSVHGHYEKAGNQVFALHCHTEDSSKADRFLNSLQLRTPDYSEQFLHIDSSLFYRSTLPWNKEDNYFESMFNVAEFAEDRSETMDAYYQSSDLTPPGTNDKITLEYQRLPRYEKISDKKEYLKSERLLMSGQGDMAIDKESYTWNETGYIADFVLSDSLSSYIYQIRKILDGNRTLTITYGQDSNQDLSVFYTRFINELHLLEDTLGKLPLFENSPSLLIEDLQSNDTALFEMSNTYIQNAYELSDEWAYAIGSALKSSCSPLASEKDKKYYQALFNRSRSSDPSAEMMHKLEVEYHQNGDSAAYQKEVLGILAKMKDLRAIEKIQGLLLEDAPVGVHMNRYDPLFSSLMDSLELSAHLYPDILQLTEYPEYRDPVLETLAILVDSNAINVSRFKKYRDYLERQGKIELKRFQSTGYDLDEHVAYQDQVGVDIRDYWSILWPWRTKKSVAEFFDRAEASNKTQVRKSFALFKLDKGLELSEDQIEQLRAKDDPIADYAFLKRIDRLDLFPSDLDIRDLFVKEIVEGQFRDYEYDWDDSKIDSIHIHETQIDSIRTRAFKTYFVTSQLTQDRDIKPQLHVVMVEMNSEAPGFKFIYKTDEVSELKTEAEQFGFLLRQLIAENRTWPYRNQPRSLDPYAF